MLKGWSQGKVALGSAWADGDPGVHNRFVDVQAFFCFLRDFQRFLKPTSQWKMGGWVDIIKKAMCSWPRRLLPNIAGLCYGWNIARYQPTGGGATCQGVHARQCGGARCTGWGIDRLCSHGRPKMRGDTVLILNLYTVGGRNPAPVDR